MLLCRKQRGNYTHGSHPWDLQPRRLCHAKLAHSLRAAPCQCLLHALGASLWGITRHGCALGAGIKSVLSFHKGKAQEESWDRQGKTFTGVPRREDKSLRWALNGLLATESKDDLPVTGFTYWSPHGFSLLRSKREELRAIAFQEACYLPPSAPYSVWESPLKPAPHRPWEPLCLACKTIWPQGFNLHQVTHTGAWDTVQLSKVQPPHQGLTISHTTIPSSSIGIYLAEQQQPGQLQL